MSADCLFAFQTFHNKDIVKKTIIAITAEYKCGAWFTPVNGLLCCNQIAIDDHTFLFEPTDSVDTIDAELLLSPPNCIVDGKEIKLPLYERLMIIQSLAECCLDYSDQVDIYISFDNPYLPDFAEYHIPYHQIADTLLSEYKNNEVPYAEIPNVCLHVSRF